VALLQLVRDGRIQVRLLPRPIPRQRDPEHHTPTLLSAFSLALEQTDYILSAWPELTEPEARVEVLAKLDRPSLIRDSSIARRLAGLLDLNAALGEPAQLAVSPRDNLGDQIQETLARLAEKSSETDALPELLAQASSLALVDRSRRSVWYRLIAERWPQYEGYGAVVRDIVDGHYNAVVGQSLRATGVYGECDTRLGARALAGRGSGGAVHERHVDMVTDLSGARYLTWDTTRDLLGQISVLSPERRLEFLQSNFSDQWRAEESNRRVIRLRVALMTTAAAAGSLLAATTAPVPGVLAGATLAGVATWISERTMLRTERALQPSTTRNPLRRSHTGRAVWTTGTATNAIGGGP
jgi:hypothetical protein